MLNVYRSNQIFKYTKHYFDLKIVSIISSIGVSQVDKIQSNNKVNKDI